MNPLLMIAIPLGNPLPMGIALKISQVASEAR
jgi:hypothetical protein